MPTFMLRSDRCRRVQEFGGLRATHFELAQRADVDEADAVRTACASSRMQSGGPAFDR
jgi:hypothetical protein